MELGESPQRNATVVEVAGAPTIAAPEENSSSHEINLNDDDDEGSPRRSGRARVSTTIQIDGHTVKRQNNYSVTGSDYIFHEAPEVDTTKVASKKKTAPTSLQQQQPKKPKLVPPAQIARTHHNQAVLAATQPKQSLRWAFLTKHRNRLEAFVEPHVWTKLQQGPADGGQQQQQQQQPVVAPKMVQATLRDYQLRGLEFMVTMHRQNLSMILGDEMGLVRKVVLFGIFILTCCAVLC